MVLACFVSCYLAVQASGGETLYNGIRLPDVWPPQRMPTQAYADPPYIASPPGVIRIDVGRQLFVDDFLIESTTLSRTQHRPVMYPGNPVLTPTAGVLPDDLHLAMPFSDGVWYDPREKKFRMYYFGGGGNGVSLVESPDALNWTKPRVFEANRFNQVILANRDSATVWMDLEDPNPARRYKAFVVGGGWVMRSFSSANGLHWTEGPNIRVMGDRTTLFYNPFRKVWVLSARVMRDLPETPTRPFFDSTRMRYYFESRNISTLQDWTPAVGKENFWLATDEHDPPYPGYLGMDGFPQLYNLDAVAYESVMVGLFSMYYAQTSNTGNGKPDVTEVNVGFSRDGYHWVRPTRGAGPGKAFLAASRVPGAWDAYNTQSSGGGFLVVGDKLYFLFSGRNHDHARTGTTKKEERTGAGVATLRRDGFYSMDAGASEGVLTTRPVRFSGRYLFVNVDNPLGALRVEVLDENDKPIPGFQKSQSAVVSADSTRHYVSWDGKKDLSSLAGQVVKFRFYLRLGKLYAFWVSTANTGASNGYVAAGGPGFNGSIDDVGAGKPALDPEDAPPAPQPPPNKLPQGVVESIGHTGTVTGWARDPDDPSKPVVVQIYVDTPAGPGRFPAATAVASLSRPDVGAFGFDMPIPASFRDGSPHVVYAYAVDLTGASTAVLTGSPKPFTLTAPDTTPPSVAIASPINGAVVSGVVNITANAWDEVGVAGVTFRVDGVPLGAEDTTRPFTAVWNTAGVPGGSHTITAVARDAAGNQRASAPVTVKIQTAEVPPVVVPPEVPPQPPVYYRYVEAESAELNAPCQSLYTGPALVSGGRFTRCTVDDEGALVYQFTVPAAGKYKLWARVSSQFTAGASVRLSINEGANHLWADPRWTRAVWTWSDAGALTLKAGVNTVTFKTRRAYTYLDLILLTNVQSFVPKGKEGGVPLVTPDGKTSYLETVEAESAATSETWWDRLHSGRYVVSGGYFIRSKMNEKGVAAYKFTVPADGTYRLWGRASKVGKGGSFNVTVDGSGDTHWDGEDWRRGEWTWSSPGTVNLKKGSHTVTIRGGKAESCLDALLLTDALGFVPKGISGNEP
jgi:hypothetical protein